MPIKMTPDDFYEAFTIGNYIEFIEDPSSRSEEHTSELQSH